MNMKNKFSLGIAILIISSTIGPNIEAREVKSELNDSGYYILANNLDVELNLDKYGILLDKSTKVNKHKIPISYLPQYYLLNDRITLDTDASLTVMPPYLIAYYVPTEQIYDPRDFYIAADEILNAYPLNPPQNDDQPLIVPPSPVPNIPVSDIPMPDNSQPAIVDNNQPAIVDNREQSIVSDANIDILVLNNGLVTNNNFLSQTDFEASLQNASLTLIPTQSDVMPMSGAITSTIFKIALGAIGEFIIEETIGNAVKDIVISFGTDIVDGSSWLGRTIERWYFNQKY